MAIVTGVFGHLEGAFGRLAAAADRLGGIFGDTFGDLASAARLWAFSRVPLRVLQQPPDALGASLGILEGASVRLAAGAGRLGSVSGRLGGASGPQL